MSTFTEDLHSRLCGVSANNTVRDIRVPVNEVIKNLTFTINGRLFSPGPNMIVAPHVTATIVCLGLHSQLPVKYQVWDSLSQKTKDAYTNLVTLLTADITALTPPSDTKAKRIINTASQTANVAL